MRDSRSILLYSVLAILFLAAILGSTYIYIYWPTEAELEYRRHYEEVSGKGYLTQEEFDELQEKAKEIWGEVDDSYSQEPTEK